MPKDRRTPEEVAEHYRTRQLRREAQVAARNIRRAASDAAHAKAKEERTTEKMKTKSDAYIKHWKSKLVRKEKKRLKNRDEREISRVDIRNTGVEERKQHGKNVQAKKERDWEASREVERQKKIKGDAVVRQIEEARGMK